MLDRVDALLEEIGPINSRGHPGHIGRFDFTRLIMMRRSCPRFDGPPRACGISPQVARGLYREIGLRKAIVIFPVAASPVQKRISDAEAVAKPARNAKLTIKGPKLLVRRLGPEREGLREHAGEEGIRVAVESSFYVRGDLLVATNVLQSHGIGGGIWIGHPIYAIYRRRQEGRLRRIPGSEDRRNSRYGGLRLRMMCRMVPTNGDPRGRWRSTIGGSRAK